MCPRGKDVEDVDAVWPRGEDVGEEEDRSHYRPLRPSLPRGGGPGPCHRTVIIRDEFGRSVEVQETSLVYRHYLAELSRREMAEKEDDLGGGYDSGGWDNDDRDPPRPPHPDRRHRKSRSRERGSGEKKRKRTERAERLDYLTVSEAGEKV